jgi:hypothetical protein
VFATAQLPKTPSIWLFAVSIVSQTEPGAFDFPLYYCGFVNRSVIGVGVWRFVEGGEHGGAIRDGGSTSLPSFRSRDGDETLRAAINHYMATSARLQ